MKQFAIVLTKENADSVAKELFGYQNKPELFMLDYSYLLEAHDTVVIGIDELEGTGDRLVSYVVSKHIFDANVICEKLNDKTFEIVTQR